MQYQRFSFLVAVHAFFIKDQKILLLERKNTGFWDGYFSVPAGHVDGGETIEDAVKREILEESGIKINHQLHPAHVMHRIVSPTEERIDYFFVITDWQGDPENCEPEKCAQLIWADLDDLPENVVPYIRFAVDQVFKENYFSEFVEKNS